MPGSDVEESVSKFARRVDANHAQVKSALIAAGAKVHDLSSTGGGVPDLLIGINGRLALFEVKDGAKVKSAQKLTKAQEEFHAMWAGFPICTVDGPEAALRHLKVLQSDKT